MPCLIECQILDVDFTMLHFGMNVASLQRVSCMESEHSLQELLFDDIVPQLYHIDLGQSCSCSFHVHSERCFTDSHICFVFLGMSKTDREDWTRNIDEW